MSVMETTDELLSTQVSKSSPCSQVLSNADLLPHIFSHLHRAKRKELLPIGLTCKNFLDFILDVVWEELESLEPLLQLIPGPGLGQFDALCPADCFLFDRYAARVRVLTLYFEPFPAYLYLRLSQQHPSPLTLNLRGLNVDNIGGDFSLVFLFLKPTLRQLTLDAALPLKPIISDMAVHGSLLHLTIEGLPNDDFIHILRLDTLQSLDIGRTVDQHLEPSFLQRLAELDHLRYLAVTVSPEINYLTMNFPALTCLEMYGGIQGVKSFVDNVMAPHLIDFNCYDDNGDTPPPSNSQLLDVLTLLSTKYPRTRVAKLFYDTIMEGGDSNRGVFRALGALPSLEKFEVPWLFFFPSDLEFSSDLRSLKSLTLPYSGGIPFKFLEAIARHCPSLQHLHLTIHFNDMDSYSVPLDFQSSSPLEHLMLFGEPDENQIPHAWLCIHRIFPRLKKANIATVR